MVIEDPTKDHALGVGPPQTFVLVHGAWHGGWCWRRVADILEKLGHKVFTPTLTGLGERSHLMSRDINLDTHIADLVNVFKWESIDNAILCGHSYAGWVISGAVEEVSSKVSALLFVDAHVPKNGQKGIDTTTTDTADSILAKLEAGSISRPPPTAAYFQVRDPGDRAWVDSLMTPQPIGVSLQPIRLTGARETIARKAYVRAALFEKSTFDDYLKEARANHWDTYEVQSGHDIMIDDPARLVEILLQVASDNDDTMLT